jgi:hypothetical protein
MSPSAGSADSSPDLSRRVEKVVGHRRLVEMDDHQRREFHEALLDADRFGDLSGRWQAAVLNAGAAGPRSPSLTG